MMTIIMIDVEAGKEDLFERLNTKMEELKTSNKYDKIKILYMVRCYTHSDISLMIDVQDPEKLPIFITDELLKMNGVWDLQTIHLFNPNFFKIPKHVDHASYQPARQHHRINTVICSGLHATLRLSCSLLGFHIIRFAWLSIILLNHQHKNKLNH